MAKFKDPRETVSIISMIGFYLLTAICVIWTVVSPNIPTSILAIVSFIFSRISRSLVIEYEKERSNENG